MIDRQTTWLVAAGLATLVAACDVPGSGYPRGGTSYPDTLDSPPYGGGGYGSSRRYSCGENEDRIRYDRQQLSRTDPRDYRGTQYYEGDLDEAMRQREQCRQAEAQKRERQYEKNDEMCRKVDDRIRYDRQQIATIDPSKHHKALQWYKDDLANAERDRSRCRGGY
jgi:hypothetical protein